jgi:hypothetical protein
MMQAIDIDRGQGIHGHGGRSYSAAQGRAIAELLQQHTGQRMAISIESMSMLLDIPDGRAIRQFLSDYDGVLFLLGESKGGYFMCDIADDAESYSRRARRQVASMQARIDRREQYAKNLPRCQSEFGWDGE